MFLPRYILLPLLFLSRLLLNLAQESEQGRNCFPFICGKLLEVGFPFSDTSNEKCRRSSMNCTESKQKVQFQDRGKWYLVEYINYSDQTILIHDKEVQSHLETSSCDSLNNFIEKMPPFLSINVSATRPFFKCKRDTYSISGSDFLDPFKNYTSCKDDNNLYFYDDPKVSLPHLPKSLSNHCSVVHLPSSGLKASELDLPIKNLRLLWHADFNITWKVCPDCLDCHRKGDQCLTSQNGTYECGELGSSTGKKALIGMVPGIVGVLLTCLISFIIYQRRKRNKLSSSSTLISPDISQRAAENYLKNYGSFAPKRYNYYDIKKITTSFKDKIGQGGFGGVYKGKLDDGRLVAVKLLNKARGDGQEFINEVASISRTSHVNIVSLDGFCFDGSKRALIYEFMANGSLEKFIYDRHPLAAHPHLGWEKLYQIAVGVARGLEYLHRGCSTRILHLDIKPHNILLDQDFIPKISDFGLAKLCPRNESIISMLDARGTAGYIAPEVFCRNFGGVSHKSDVYSYGMMVLEIVGRRKNIDVRVDHTSEIYFPHWIYKRLELDEDLGLRGVLSQEEEDMTRKMILVALWCIQTNPLDRPSMSKVVEMLEGKYELLSIPPQPYLCSPARDPVTCSNT